MSTTIEWTQPPGYKGETWNPTVGCAKVSAGCKHCYAEVMAHRQVYMGNADYADVMDGKRWNGDVNGLLDRLDIPLHWKKPRCVFVNSMSDLFHKDVSFVFIKRVFETIRRTPEHLYIILTKRPKRMRAFILSSGTLDGSSLPNVILGTSIENQETADERIQVLQNTRAVMRLISYEPALGPIDFKGRLEDIHWVIVGGESGHGARPFEIAWAQDTIEQCREAGVACFVKQIGANPWENLPVKYQHPKGSNWNEWPEDLRVREWPERFFGLGVEEARQ